MEQVQDQESTSGARPEGDGMQKADPQTHPELTIPGGQRAFCVGCSRDIEGEVVPVSTSRGSLVYSHDDPNCLESAMSVAEDPSAGVIYPGKPRTS